MVVQSMSLVTSATCRSNIVGLVDLQNLSQVPHDVLLKQCIHVNMLA